MIVGGETRESEMSDRFHARRCRQQLPLFDAPDAALTRSPGPPPNHCDTVQVRDMPAYPRELVELVDRSLAALASDRVWFTYNDIRSCFGVSRATVARRVRDRLVPGVRLIDGRVQEDGAVRRFDRTQLRWLLLAVLRRPQTLGAMPKNRLL